MFGCASVSSLALQRLRVPRWPWSIPVIETVTEEVNCLHLAFETGASTASAATVLEQLYRLVV